MLRPIKQTLLTIAFLGFGMVASAQDFIGATFDQVKYALEQTGDQFKIVQGNDVQLSIIVTYKDLCVERHYFDNSKKCNLTIVVPESDIAQKLIVESYNKNKVVSSSTKWRDYKRGITINGELIYSEKMNGYFFRWEQEK